MLDIILATAVSRWMDRQPRRRQALIALGLLVIGAIGSALVALFGR